jgi:uncharacterized membrane protein YjfL (UPF0719 family)
MTCWMPLLSAADAPRTDWAAVELAFLNSLLLVLLYVGVNSVFLPLGVWLYSLTIARGRSLISKLFVDKTGSEPNTAVGIALGGYVIALAYVTTAAVAVPSGDYVRDLIMTVQWALAANVILLVLRWFGDVITPGSWTEEVFEKKNVAVAWVEFALFVGFGLIIGTHVRG